MEQQWISFTTDYGLEDGFVAACVGVIARIAPAARVLHVSHAVPAEDVRRGAVVLADTVSYLPTGTHLAVVDPGVGTSRRPVVIETEQGLLVGPDNGLLIAAAEQLGGVRSAYELREPDYRLPTVSATFHGRDIFAPAAAHLAVGVPPDQFGPAIDPAGLFRLPTPTTIVEAGRLATEVRSVDHFGNIQLAASASDLDRAGLQPGATIRVRIGARSMTAAVGRKFADVPVGEAVVFADSADHLAVAVNGGSAVTTFGMPTAQAQVLLESR